MAAEVGDDLRLARAVRSIVQGPGACRLGLADGGSIEPDFVIVAVPFSTLRHIRMTPSLPEAQAKAIHNMVYNNQSPTGVATILG